MRGYSLNKIAHLVAKDPSFRESVKADPSAAIDGFDLTEAERTALLEGDVDALIQMGGHGYLLTQLAVQQAFGLDVPTYIARKDAPRAASAPAGEG